ncbi:MAG TPA: iron-containing redox enzyme family protein [Burkholderiales bacterium]|nr:iron-containing redox enzyme family protein [Burkholderiales bacterium]
MGASEVLAVRLPWVDSLHAYVKPYWDHLLDGPWAEGVATGKLTLPEMQGWMLQIYPFIHAFPKFLAEALIKVEDDYSRSFFINNIRVEKGHAEHWLWMGEGFGVQREAMLELADGTKPLLRDVQSLTDWLWHVNTKGSLAEAVAATSFAIEGIAGDIARKVTDGFKYYKDEPGVDLSSKTYRWMREHAHYDDEHPKIALEIVQRYATTERMQTRVMLAAKRSIQMLDHALVTSYQAFSDASTSSERVERDLRASERRKAQVVLAFPDRRFRERRGLQARIAA